MYSVILAAIDVAVPDISRGIITRAMRHLEMNDCTLHLQSIAPANATENDKDTIRAHLMSIAEEMIRVHEQRIKLHVSCGLPAEQVLGYGEKIAADLILIGSHRGGRGQLGRSSLGSTAAKVAAQAHCDVCIVRPG